MKKKIFLIFLIFSSLNAKEILKEQPTLFCLFSPPKDWVLAPPESYSPRVKICFIKQLGSGFFPSLNLSIESTNKSINQYLKIVKKIHEKNPNNRFRELGSINTKAGNAQLTEIDTKTKWGDVRLLQLIFLKNKTAYILTAGALRENFSQYAPQFYETFRSLDFTDDLFEMIPALEEKKILKESYNELVLSWQEKPGSLKSSAASILKAEEFLSFQRLVAKQSDLLGIYWQMLIMQSAIESVLK